MSIVHRAFLTNNQIRSGQGRRPPWSESLAKNRILGTVSRAISFSRSESYIVSMSRSFSRLRR